MEQCAEQGQLITGFHIPVIFYNTTMVDDTLLPDKLADYAESSSLADFLDGKGALYLSDTSDYYAVQEGMPGRYGIISANGLCTYSTAWSIARTVSDDGEKVAVRFLEYMLSERAQDLYFVQHQNVGLPVNRKAADILMEVNAEMIPLLKDMEEIDSSGNE